MKGILLRLLLVLSIIFAPYYIAAYLEHPQYPILIEWLSGILVLAGIGILVAFIILIINFIIKGPSNDEDI